jgi:serine/threonine protein kinase
MMPAIALGTLLRQRYLIQQILGQGGFGRTYLAVDQERFNEACVLKELVIEHPDPAIAEKAKALFQREASTLYHLQHPQIPRFWAAFEWDQRLFLVQDFVDGQTYQHLLQQRNQHRQSFSELEVLHLLGHLLPVLSYLHERDIVHRYISPENIMLPKRPAALAPEPRSGLALPMLIDFGAVKEAAGYGSGLYGRSPDSVTWAPTSTMTCVGKLGYAPPEQIQTGKVFPHSDLYALGVTCLVLLTGRSPQDLLDGETLDWQWEPQTSLGQKLAPVLRRMLSLHPRDRYQAAAEVQADLQPLLGPPPETQIFSSTALSTAAPASWGTSPSVEPSFRLPHSPVPLDLAPTSRWSWDRLQATLGLVLGAGFVLGGLGLLAQPLWQSSDRAARSSDVWMAGVRIPQSEASKILGSTPAAVTGGLPQAALQIQPNQPIAAPRSAQPETILPVRQLALSPGEVTTTLQGTLENYGVQPYVLEGAEGQVMSLSLDGQSVVMNVLGADQKAIDSAASRARRWTGSLPQAGTYTIQVLGSGSYTLRVALLPMARPQEATVEAIQLKANVPAIALSAQMSPNTVKRYQFQGQQGQVLKLRRLRGSVGTLSLRTPTGQVIEGPATLQAWQSSLPATGEYTLEVSVPQPTEVAIAWELRSQP